MENCSKTKYAMVTSVSNLDLKNLCCALYLKEF